MRRTSEAPAWIMVCLSLIALVGMAGVVAWGVSTNHAASSTIRVVAAEQVWGDIASQIGGDRVSVHSIISGNQLDPHLYESSAADASAVAGARLVITNGLGYDAFMDRLLSASPSPERGLVTAAKAMGMPEGANPHLWYDVPQIHRVAAAIERQLELQDPSHTAEYRARLQAFTASLQPLQTTLAIIRSRYAGTPVLYTERVAAYLVRAAGLTDATPSGFSAAIEEGEAPSPADLSTVTTKIATHSVAVVLYNSQADTPAAMQVRSLARQHGVPVVAVTEAMPANQTYQQWQGLQMQTLLEALQ